ncbi:sensor histidine kinase [Oerskovia flava]|uniref:sensor histidine kinase n=1 Tax=Oerskovia flava TaxID=2986422 RepID=UPI00224049B0|nr:histidine kinase [Oerskovia sp. JB1-3-2]
MSVHDAGRRLLARLGIRSDLGRDTVLAGVVATLSVGMFLVVDGLLSAEILAETADLAVLDGIHVTPAVRATTCLLLVAQSMALCLRRRAPALTLGLTVVGQVAIDATLPAGYSIQGPATIVAAYTVGAYASRRTTLWSIPTAVVASVVLGFVLGGGAGETQTTSVALSGIFVSTAITYLGAVLAGAYVGARRELLRGLHAQVAQAEREREALATQAVLEERGRMARELHDVAAHHLSGIVVQATAAERLVASDPERAQESMRWIRAQGRETLDNLRLVVGILRSDVDGPVAAAVGEAEGGAPVARFEPAEHVPQPTVADLPDLLSLARTAGTQVREETVGEPFELGPAAQLTVYRVLQEALSNARRHAPGRTIDVLLEHGASALVLTVRNPGVTPVVSDHRGDSTGSAATTRGSAEARAEARAGEVGGPQRQGHGVIGMTERAAMIGGTLVVGPLPEGTWQVRLTVPRPATSRTPAGSAHRDGRPQALTEAPAEVSAKVSAEVLTDRQEHA